MQKFKLCRDYATEFHGRHLKVPQFVLEHYRPVYACMVNIMSPESHLSRQIQRLHVWLPGNCGINLCRLHQRMQWIAACLASEQFLRRWRL